MMKRCSACRKTYRAGSLIYARAAAGGLKQVRVCRGCAALAVPVLVGGIEASRCKCGAPATSCVACVRDDEKADPKKRFKSAIKKIQTVIDAYAAKGLRKDDQEMWRIQGLEQAIDLIEAGDF